jgi:lipopolysaccharide biosynthesis glycosyltransferase
MSSKLVRVAFATDDGYARPLAVAGASVIRHLGKDRNLELYVLDMGISKLNRRKIEESFAGPQVKVSWIAGRQEAISGLPSGGPWITRSTYARLLLPDVLPAHVDRVLYLDCDLVVRRCIGELYDLEFDGAVALAVLAMGTPFVCSLWGVGGWFESGRAASDLNFNAGVMLMDLTAWRREQIGQTVLGYARACDPDHPLVADQESLNATFGPRIRSIDPRWNQQSELFSNAHASLLPYSRERLIVLRNDPWVIHYSQASKPWQADCSHPWVNEWYRNLDETAYRGWRPPWLPTAVRQAVRKRFEAVRQTLRRFGVNKAVKQTLRRMGV